MVRCPSTKKEKRQIGPKKKKEKCTSRVTSSKPNLLPSIWTSVVLKQAKLTCNLSSCGSFSANVSSRSGLRTLTVTVRLFSPPPPAGTFSDDRCLHCPRFGPDRCGPRSGPNRTHRSWVRSYVRTDRTHIFRSEVQASVDRT